MIAVTAKLNLAKPSAE